MALIYTAEELIESIRNLGMVPKSGTQGGDDADILRHINESMSLDIIPALMEIKEEYFVVTTRLTLGAALKYRIPTRAIADKLRYIRYVDSSGSRSSDSMEEIPPSCQNEFSWSSTSKPSAYYIEGNYICLVGSSFSGYLEVSWYFRPGQLVLSTECRQITSILAKTVTLSSAVPTTWSTVNEFDIHSTESGAEIKVWGESATAVGGAGTENKITFTNAIDGTTFGTHTVEVGDWVCLEKEAAIPAVPVDIHPLLIRAVSMRLAESQGDAQNIRVEHDLFVEAKKGVLKNFNYRSGNPPRIKGCRGILWKMANAR
jgi:hypothetical protein